MLLVFLSDFPLIVFNILPATGMPQASLAHGQLGILTRPVVEGRLGRPRPQGNARWLRIRRHASAAGIWLYDSFCLFFSPVVHTIQEAPQLTVPKIVGSLDTSKVYIVSHSSAQQVPGSVSKPYHRQGAVSKYVIGWKKSEGSPPPEEPEVTECQG